MAYRLAKALEALRAAVNTASPNRNKASDGWIGDAAHRKKKSDHNPVGGVVKALDITHDPVRGVDAGKIAEAVKNDPRVKYVIWNEKIWNPSISKSWRPSKGHTKHVHISVHPDKARYDDDKKPWDLGIAEAAKVAASLPPAAAQPPAKAKLKRGSKGGDVFELQRLLDVTVDGSFGPKTEKAVKAFQTQNGLVADGIVGAYTWEALEASGRPGATVGVSGPSPEQTGNLPVPAQAMKTFESLGWSKIASAALVASLMWESAGNSKNTIFWDAKGDKDKHGVFKSLYAPQWNGPRIPAYEAFATRRGRPFTDPETQLLYIDHELATTERKAAARLRAATTIEEANTAAISFWRPSIPHADKRLAIAKKLLA